MTDGTPDPRHDDPDPFGERAQPPCHARSATLLGGEFAFRSTHPELLALVDRAYAGLPAQRFAGAAAPHFEVELRYGTAADGADGAPEPPPPRMQGGAGLFGVLLDAGNLALAAPAMGTALVALTPALLQRFPYHARYELLEFAVFTLASRAQGLVPLHAACIGRDGRGVLLIGASGAGKSTLTLQALLEGWDFVTEDAAFVEPRRLQVGGVANFLHLRRDARLFVEDPALAARIRGAPLIRRRSGVEKFEIDLRRLPGARLAAAPLRLAAVLFLSPDAAGPGQDLLRPLDARRQAARLAASQPYAAQLPSWRMFQEQWAAAHLRAFELRRADHPRAALSALRALLADGSGAGS